MWRFVNFMGLKAKLLRQTEMVCLGIFFTDISFGCFDRLKMKVIARCIAFYLLGFLCFWLKSLVAPSLKVKLHISVLWPPLSSTMKQQRPIICLIQSAHLTPISQAQARHSRQVLQIGWFCLKQQLLLWCVQFLRQIYLSGLYVFSDDKTLKM